MNISIDIHFDRHATEADLQRRWKRGISVATSELRRYANQYVRVLTGKMKDSSYMASDLSKGLVVYDVPYAQYAYYNEDNTVTKKPNPNARPKWGEYAIQHHLREIERTVQREVDRA